LALNRLGERDGEALVQKLAGNALLTPDIVTEIVERTDGVPLFVEELTKAVLESVVQSDRATGVLGTTSLATLSVPATLHASLMARLDRLGPMPKEIAQIGAVLGREFSYELIDPVAQRPEKELQAALAQLSEAGLLFCRGAAPHSSYLFKHALVQDAAYSTLLRGRRQELHARVAAALEQYIADLVERQPELLAHHLMAAGATERAVDQWVKAGAACRSAIGLPRSDCPSRAGSRPAAFITGEPGPEQPRTRAATGIGTLCAHRQRRRRSEAALYAGARAWRERRHAAATV